MPAESRSDDSFTPIFGKRRRNSVLPSPERGAVPFAVLAKMRLAAICRDLLHLYQDAATLEKSAFVRLVDQPDPCLLIGEHGAVTVDLARGLYVFSMAGREPGSVTIETASEERLLDHIICHLAVDRGQYFSTTSYGLIANLVGRTLEDVEHSLILATLRQHHFNRTRAAATLGISVRTILNKLKAYRRERNAVSEADRIQLLRKPQPDGV